jgi:hypothetical protein
MDNDDTYTISGIEGLTVGGIISPDSLDSSYVTYTTNSTFSNTPPGYTISTGTTPYTFTGGAINIDSTPNISIPENGDLKIGDVSLKEFMKTVQDRLSILVPDPDKLEKYEALKKAYEHYKLLEKLCFNDSSENKSV